MSVVKIVSLFVLLFSVQSYATSHVGKYFDRAIIVIFENTNYSAALKQPFFKKLAQQGTLFSNFLAITHPSQGNYIALTSGSLNGVKNDNNYDVDSRNITDLIEEKGLTWKVYAEGFPGHCFTGKTSGNYARKHVPFISYLNIQNDPVRCAKIVEASEFDRDAKNGTLPDYIFYAPDMRNDGHDTGVTFADAWYAQKFGPYLNDAQFMKDTVLISTFDESGPLSAKNQIYTSIVGPSVKSGVVSDQVTLYSLLNMLEDNWNLGSLGKNDLTAKPILAIWK